MAANYKPNIYRKAGSTELTVASGGMIAVEDGGNINIEAGGALQVAGTDVITTGGGIALAALTSGDVDFPGNLTLTSGLNASTGTFSGNITGGGNLTLTSGLNGTTGTFSSGVTIGGNLTVTSGVNASTGTFSSGASFGAAVTFTSGITATTGNFSGSIAVSSAASVANTLTMSSAASVAHTFTMSSAMVRPFETFATGISSGQAIAIYGVSEIWSSGTQTGRLYSLAAGVAGYEKWIYNLASTSTAPSIVQTSGSAAMVDGTNTSIIFSTGSANKQWIFLLAQNSTNWMVLAKSTDVTLSAT